MWYIIAAEAAKPFTDTEVILFILGGAITAFAVVGSAVWSATHRSFKERKRII